MRKGFKVNHFLFLLQKSEHIWIMVNWLMLHLWCVLCWIHLSMHCRINRLSDIVPVLQMQFIFKWKQSKLQSKQPVFFSVFFYTGAKVIFSFQFTILACIINLSSVFLFLYPKMSILSWRQSRINWCNNSVNDTWKNWRVRNLGEEMSCQFLCFFILI